VLFGIQNEREWRSFCGGVLEQPQVAVDARFDTNERRSANRGELEHIIGEVFATLTAAQVVDRLDAAAIANAHINTMADVWAHEQLKARGRWSQTGPLPALLPPGQREARMGAVPALGEHTDAILRELGYSEPDVARMREAKAV
jgi:itaconate CoA-transferase